MTSSAKWFLLTLLAFLGTRRAFSSTRTGFSCLPVLALLLGTLGLFGAAPAQAQPVWSATLTVKAPDGDRGCFGSTGTTGCKTAFDDWDFTHDSTDYNVHGLIVSEHNNNRHLDLLLSKKIPDAIKALKLCVGTTGYAISDGTISDDVPVEDDNAVRWRIASDALSWSTGDTVPVSLASSCTAQAQDVVLDIADFVPISEGVDQYYELIVPANGSATFGVKLSAAPTSTATVVLTKTIGRLGARHHDVNAVTVSPTELTFTSSNFNDAQTVTVTGVPGRVNSHEHLVIVVVNRDSESGSAGAVKGIYVTVIDDTAVKVGAWPGRGRETGDGSTRNMDVTVWLSKAATGQVTVDYATADGTAIAGSDYTAVSGTVTFAAGETRKTVQVPITDDSVEDSGEHFYLVLSNAQGATLDPDYTRAFCDILNDEVNQVGGGAVQGSGGSGQEGPPEQTPTNTPASPGETYSPDDGGSPPEEPSDTPCGKSDREDLESFYVATGGDAWDSNENWNSQELLDEWFGVETDEDGEVISLRLEENNLSGGMPTEELLCLNENTELKELALWDNEDLLGKVPKDLVRAVERAVLKDVAVAEALSLNAEWFEDYEDPFNFEDWHEGVTTDDEGRVTGLDFTGEEIEGEIPESVYELQRLRGIETGCGVTLETEAPKSVRVTMPDDCVEETPVSGGGGCALSPEGSSAFSLVFLTLVVFAVLVRKRAR